MLWLREYVRERGPDGLGQGGKGLITSSLLFCFQRDKKPEMTDITLAEKLMKRSCPKTSFDFFLSAQSHLIGLFNFITIPIQQYICKSHI